MSQFGDVEYKVGKNSCGWIIIEAGGIIWSWYLQYQIPRAQYGYWYRTSETRDITPLLPDETANGWTLAMVTKMMDKYGWMFVDPLARIHHGRDLQLRPMPGKWPGTL